MLKDLERCYQKQRILPTAFCCEFKDDCRSDCTTFTESKSAFVSDRYERRDLPRLLFISQDSGGGSSNVRDRLPEAVRREEMEFSVLSLRGKQRSWHWYRTHELAWYILRCFDTDIQLEEVKRCFAHTNAAKCSVGKAGNHQDHKRLTTNCREHLYGELSVLCPDILVTQGVWAKWTITEKYGTGTPLGDDTHAARIEMDNRHVFWLHTHLPRYWGFWRQRDDGRGWERYAHMIYQFGCACGWPRTTPSSA